MSTETPPPAAPTFDPRNPRHWMQAVVFAVALYLAYKGGTTPPPPPVFLSVPAVVTSP